MNYGMHSDLQLNKSHPNQTKTHIEDIPLNSETHYGCFSHLKLCNLKGDSGQTESDLH